MADEVIGIVGGGIVGLAIGREITRRRPGSTVIVFEKESRLAAHQTGHNSGVVHAGIYYRPGSLKAELCHRGRHLLREYCIENALPYQECGKLVVAVASTELGRLQALQQTATQNRVPGLRRVSSEEISELEPHTVGLAALHSPATAITDYVAVAEAFGRDVRAAEGEIRLSTEVANVRRRNGRIELTGDRLHHMVDRLVICAGLQSDRVSHALDGEAGPRIIGFRGEYLTVRSRKQDFVRGLVYPVPDPRYPFLGVHFTRRVSGELDIGPNAVLALRRESYRRFAVSLSDLGSILSWPGSWRMARAHWKTGVVELRGSLSIKAYLKGARRYVPDIEPADVVRSGAGIRAQAVDRDGSLVDDFRINHTEKITTVRNAPSPAATSSLAIAEYVVDGMGLV